jgi:hypothetical protein
MAKKTEKLKFNNVLAKLGNQRFDVGGTAEGANRPAGAVRVSKFGCAAVIGTGPAGQAVLLERPGWVLGGEISRLLDRGFQKFLVAGKLEIPATADALRAIHAFSRELDAATGELELYNEALGTTTDVYLYDRVAGRPDAAR